MRSMAVSMRSIVVLGLIAALVGLSGEPAGAHAALVSSDPAAAQRLATTPALVVLRFTEPLNDRLSRATVIGPDGQRFQGGASGPGELRVRLLTRGWMMSSSPRSGRRRTRRCWWLWACCC